jgi:hypothetical protein
MWLIDPKTGEKSVTLTMFVIGMIVATLKLALSGITVNKVVFLAFSGTDFAAVVGALGAIYAARKATDK